jgi:hypothetical protein
LWERAGVRGINHKDFLPLILTFSRRGRRDKKCVLIPTSLPIFSKLA